MLTNFITACSKSETSEEDIATDTNYAWIIQRNDLRGNRNPFPFMENPSMSSVSNVTELQDNTTVVIVSINKTVHIYPLDYVQRYELVNNQIDGIPFSISYCPITQSTINLSRIFGQKNLTLRASGILYKNNVVMLDEASDTYWSQMELRCIKGKYQFEELNTLPLLETTWQTAKTYFPNASVFTSRSVSSKQNTSKTEIKPTEKVYGLLKNSNSIKSDVLLYSYINFSNGTQIYNNQFSENTIVVGNAQLKFITSFLNENNNQFEALQNQFPLILKDKDENIYDVFGNAVSGPNKGMQLKHPIGFVAYLWAWEAFYENITIVE